MAHCDTWTPKTIAVPYPALTLFEVRTILYEIVEAAIRTDLLETKRDIEDIRTKIMTMKVK